MAQTGQWRPMASAPKDGSRILVTVRPVEQGPADVDVAYWAQADPSGSEGWRAADSSPGCSIAYADTELTCWMPLPSADPAFSSVTAARAVRPWDGDRIEVDGSGI